MERAKQDSARQELGTGQEQDRRHDCTVGQADDDRRSGEAVIGANGLSAQIGKKARQPQFPSRVSSR